MAKKRTDERNGENLDGEEPCFDDPEDFVDDISDQGVYSFLFIKMFALNFVQLKAMFL